MNRTLRDSNRLMPLKREAMGLATLLFKALWMMMMRLIGSFITLCFNSSAAAVFRRLTRLVMDMFGQTPRDTLYTTHSGRGPVHTGMDILAFMHIYTWILFIFKICLNA